MKPCAKWVRLEDEHGTLSLVSKRANCGAVTRYSPSKKAKIDELMDQTEGEPSLREVQAACEIASSTL